MIVKKVSATELSIKEIDTLCQQYLAILYHNAQIGNKKTRFDVCETYGELLYPSVDKILSVIQPTSNDVFIDYGSGLGKMVIQVFLKSPVKQAYGIEILPELHQQALNAAIGKRGSSPFPGAQIIKNIKP